jgi:hypothetical protein
VAGCFFNSDHNTDTEPWRSYGYDEPVIKEFLRKYPNTSLFVKTVDLLLDGCVLVLSSCFCQADPVDFLQRWMMNARLPITIRLMTLRI